ncbi:RING-H2 finger protein ATL8-like [Canna indica]|uniref:RING-H2 finger protein ATL8-like n=1 Tax=Canna indica TaxID=4628 RepID=A0AAQ3QC13_9LILI|nr:RING-H2 finger protein ATL8-like [Canna indica]
MRSPPGFVLPYDPALVAEPPAEASTSPVTVNVNSDVVAILAALLCAVVCVLGLAFAARCAWLRRSSAEPSSAPPRPPIPPPPRKGLKKKALRAMPTLSFVSSSADAAASSGGIELVDCAICLAEFADGDDVRVLPQCGHGFHAACVDTWLGAHASCPSCRRVLVVPAPPRQCHRCAGASSVPKKTECSGAGA